MTEYESNLSYVIDLEIQVMEHIKKNGLTGYQQVDLNVHIQLLESLKLRAKLMSENDRT